jgi:hypothetical protein
MSSMLTEIIEMMKNDGMLSRSTIQKRLRITREKMNWAIWSLLGDGKIRRVMPSEVGSGKYYVSDNNNETMSDDARKKKVKYEKRERKKSFGKKQVQKLHVFALV